jgi:cell fate (sporulation/competence/biofilm development) regulator YlbF (YheA/YmcA/DUF963 family)
LNEDVKQAAEEFGKLLAENQAVEEFHRLRAEAEKDPEALRLRAELERTYDDLMQRQAAGEILSRGEIEAYYELEQRVRAHPLLASYERSLERLKDVFSEANQLLTRRLGFNLKDLVD